ncbi:MAG: hypothetical protein IPM71_15600 [Bacteroidota bacterium]|nr:MAG: hypothetical protein IPM71_15600 [Bacteroidota bacterium]
MKQTIGLSIILLILSLNSYAQNSIIDKIDNKTWFEENGFAGTTIVFYQTSNGLNKAIKQINGSGVPVVASGIYDVEFQTDSIILFNGLNLNTSDKLEDSKYSYDKTSGHISSLGIMFDVPTLYTWTDKRKDVNTQIDVKRLTDIPIKTNEIYKEEDLVKILIDK